MTLAKGYVSPGSMSWYYTQGGRIPLSFYLMPPVMAELAGAGGLADLSLEELANIQITSVSRPPENLSEATASIFVITAEDIRSSGATTVPEILRLAPNLQMARRDSVQYVITACGFNNTYHADEPDDQWTVRSGSDFPANLELDFQFCGVDALTVDPVPYYTELNVRLGRLPWENSEMSVTGNNLLHDDHAEFGPAKGGSEIARTVMPGVELSL